MYLLPVSICIFFEKIFGAGYKSIIRRLWQINLIHAIVALTILLIDKDAAKFIGSSVSFFMISTILILLTTSLKFVLNGNLEAKLFTAGFSIFGLFGLRDLIADLKEEYSQPETYYWGMFIFLIILGFILERRFVEARDRLQAYSQELESNNAALQRMDKLKDEFLANTSHELRTPLNGIIGIAESMIDGATGSLTSLQVANLSLVVSNGRRLAHLVNDLLDFSKLKYKNIGLQIKPLGMREITDIVLTLSQPLIGKKPFFESFEQADGSISRQYGGAGLGLAVTKQLVQLHSKEIRVESEPGKNSRFTFTLPLSQELKAESSPGLRIESPEVLKVQDLKLPTPNFNLQPADFQSSTSSGGFHILIVDDEPVNLQVLVNHLSLQNYTIAQASNGMEALAVIQNGFKPDLILLDVMMPRMTGYEVCQKIRERFPANELPVVLLTAKNQVSDLLEGFVLCRPERVGNRDMNFGIEIFQGCFQGSVGLVDFWEAHPL